MLTVHAVNANLKVQLGSAGPAVPSEVLAHVEAIWKSEKERRGDNLFNGRLFSIENSGPERITGWFAEYRWFLAQRRDPSLYQVLKIRPLGVTGLLCCADGIVLGRRAGHVEMDAGLWELVPSGGVDGSQVDGTGQPDLGAHLLTELEEESGIQAAAVSTPPQAFVMVEDHLNHVTDVGLIVRVNHSAGQVQELFAALTDREYDELEVVPASRISDFLMNRSARLAEVSRAILDSAARQADLLLG